MISRFLRVPAALAQKHRERAERERIYDAKYSARYRQEHDVRHKSIPWEEKEFIVWDGEGPQDTGYSLLGNSRGMEICYPHLRTKHCLDLIIESGSLYPSAIHVGFGFNYDVSCILWELPWRALNALHEFGRTVWRGYRIEHVPRKWFQVKHGNVTVRIYDVWSFFSSSLVSALEKWSIGPWNAPSQDSSPAISQESSAVPPLSVIATLTERELVETFKKLRSKFHWKDIEAIRVYMRLELRYTKVLCEKLRETFNAAGFRPRSWHGPGALAREAFTRHHIYDTLTKCPEEVNQASCYAFVGGRFQPFIVGHIQRTLYCYDIRSAYPYFIAQLPNLRKGEWVHVTNDDLHGVLPFGVYHIRYNSVPDSSACYPLPYRDKHGMVSWPHRVEGWYWNPEAQLVAGDPDAEIIEGWVFREDNENDRPFAWIAEYYEKRALLKKLDNPAEYTFKLIINSVYGQLAQRVGWDKKTGKPPKTHQIELAGWVTSSCRAMVYEVARKAGKDLVSIDTDGIMSLRPLDVSPVSEELGAWEVTEYEEAIIWQSGMYYLKSSGEWQKAKSRGLPKGSYTPEQLITCLESGEPLRLSKKVFYGYGLALRQRSMLNKWAEEPHEFVLGGSGKSYHPGGKACERACPGNGMHRVYLPVMLYGPFGECMSKPHVLPWKVKREDYEQKQYLIDLEWFDENHLDYDESWVLGL